MSRTLWLCSAGQSTWKDFTHRDKTFLYAHEVSVDLCIKDMGLVLVVFDSPEKRMETLHRLAALSGWSGTAAAVTAGISATRLAKDSGLTNRFVGFQCAPSENCIQSVEIFRGEYADSMRCQQVEEVFQALGVPVTVCRDQSGGILPRVLAATINEAAFMVQSGLSSVEEVDRMMRLAANFPYGPFEWADRIGIDRVLATLEALVVELGPQYQPCQWIRRKVEAGHLGMKAGRGFYNYGQERGE
jgi:3-hydroxybutyryl-CoA dehydrogenase